MDEILQLSAVALAAAVRRRRWSPVDVVEAYLARVGALDPHVAAYIRILADDARAEARAREAEARTGTLAGPLHGVPVAIKDLMTVRGVPMTAGAAFLGQQPEAEDAEVVRRLRGAGAIVLGVTALNEFALGTSGVNPHGRTARNPWNLERITGGSSSGSGAAVAARLAALAVGTDTGGSIRIPAALCGIVGLKPTFGRVSRRGVLPLADSFDTVGPMARTVEDAALMLEVMAGRDPRDPHTVEVPVGRYRQEMTADLAGLRVGRLTGPFFEADLDPAVESALDRAARALEGGGLRVRPLSLRGVEAVHEAQLVVLRAEAHAFHQTAFPGRLAEYNPDVRALLEQGGATTPQGVAAARAVLEEFGAEVDHALGDLTLLLAPAAPGGAPSVADADPRGPRWPEVRRKVARFTRIFNATGLPTIAVPAGLTTDGLPVGIQLAAAPFAEGALLAAARLVEAAIGWSLPDLPASAG